MIRPEPVAYMKRTRAYYEAQGFERAYAYAHHLDAPLTPLSKPLSQCKIGLVTTASIYERAPLEPRKVDSGPTSQPPQRLFTSDLSWDKQATHTDDLNSFCPVETVKELVAAGQVGALAAHFHCAPTEYSHRATEEQDAPEIHQRLLRDNADIALLVPL